jgi:hypothetical protein
MRNLFSTLAVVLAAASVVPAQMNIDMLSTKANSNYKPEVVVTGYLIDAKCASANWDTIVTAASTHTTECSVGCPTGEYGVVMPDGMWVPFDEKSSKKVAKLLAKTTTAKGLKVSARGSVNGEVFSVSGLKEIKPKND